LGTTIKSKGEDINIISLLQNISKSDSNETDIFDSKFGQNKSIFLNLLFLILCIGVSNMSFLHLSIPKKKFKYLNPFNLYL